jgi:hypothetical protein
MTRLRCIYNHNHILLHFYICIIYISSQATSSTQFSLKWEARKGLTIKQVNWMKQFSIFNDYWFFFTLSTLLTKLTTRSSSKAKKQKQNTNDDDDDDDAIVCCYLFVVSETFFHSQEHSKIWNRTYLWHSR